MSAQHFKSEGELCEHMSFLIKRMGSEFLKIVVGLHQIGKGFYPNHSSSNIHKRADKVDVLSPESMQFLFLLQWAITQERWSNTHIMGARGLTRFRHWICFHDNGHDLTSVLSHNSMIFGDQWQRIYLSPLLNGLLLPLQSGPILLHRQSIVIPTASVNSFTPLLGPQDDHVIPLGTHHPIQCLFVDILQWTQLGTWPQAQDGTWILNKRLWQCQSRNVPSWLNVH